MAIIRQQFEEAIAGHYLPYLINGDDSGLSDTDIQDADQFMSAYERDLSADEHIVLDVTSEEPNCTECSISGLLADCYDVVVNILGSGS